MRSLQGEDGGGASGSASSSSGDVGAPVMLPVMNRLGIRRRRLAVFPALDGIVGRLAGGCVFLSRGSEMRLMGGGRGEMAPSVASLVLVNNS